MLDSRLTQTLGLTMGAARRLLCFFPALDARRFEEFAPQGGAWIVYITAFNIQKGKCPSSGSIVCAANLKSAYSSRRLRTCAYRWTSAIWLETESPIYKRDRALAAELFS